MVKYKCIYCGTKLEHTNDKYQCSVCNHQYNDVDEIKMFNTETNYYGDLPESEMKVLLEQMDNNEWNKLIYDYFAKSNPFLYYMITNNSRADWQYLLDLNSESLVLDIGAGWGTLTLLLSERAKVVSLDGTYDRLSFIKKRVLQEKTLNVVDYVNANVLNLPFQEEQFDLVVLNGVLEWVGASVENGDPYELQLQALKNVYDVLKDGSYLYIGIENRYGLKYLIGAEDDHTLLPDITYIDRNEANEYAQKSYGRDYRTYTYDKKGYEDILYKAGFTNLDFYYPYPDYKSMYALMDLDSNVIKYYNENIEKRYNSKDFKGRVQILENITSKLNNAENFVPSFGIIAKKVSK